MGRSTASCLKLITCGSDSAADRDDVDAPEEKGDKKGWSFRKRSARHRVLSNTVISESPPPPPPTVKKETPESAVDVGFESPINKEVPEKAAIPEFDDEKPQLAASVESKQSDPDPTVDAKAENTRDLEREESAAIAIQTAVRGYLAERELVKLKNLIKLQAAVRGHLVRRHAAGTLRCVQAIVKMQALVRARRARALAECSLEADDGKSNEDAPKSNVLDKASVKNKPPEAYVSIEKLLSNRFARQLLESTPKEKPINIKCDMSKRNSAWTWLERWMSASSAEPSPSIILTSEDSSAPQAETNHNQEVCAKPEEDSSSSKHEVAVTSESDDNLITYEEDKIKFEECQSEAAVIQETEAHPVVPEIMELEHPQLVEEVGASDEKERDIPSTESPEAKPEVEAELPKRSMKRSASEELEAEGDKSVSGSRKATNPAFIAAQSKFEELTSVANSDETKLVNAVSQEDSVTESNASNLAENPATEQTRIQLGGSECGTELSISSTLDSPDRYDAGIAELENDAKATEDEKIEPGSTAVPESILSESTSDLPQKNGDDVAAGSSLTIAAAEIVQQEIMTQPDVPREDTETVQQAHNGSPEASPRSHMTVPESQGTPASQVSVNTKGSKIEKTGSNSIHKRKLLSKKSSTSPYSESGASSTNRSKDQKSSKRRNSFGSVKAESADQEPRDSSSSNSLPHFMQATESAKAKLQANNSPRSSPDVSDREILVKKRHSLPGANGRHGSPRIQRSTSQAQQGGKANGGPAQERKWLR